MYFNDPIPRAMLRFPSWGRAYQLPTPVTYTYEVSIGGVLSTSVNLSIHSIDVESMARSHAELVSSYNAWIDASGLSRDGFYNLRMLLTSAVCLTYARQLVYPASLAASVHLNCDGWGKDVTASIAWNEEYDIFAAAAVSFTNPFNAYMASRAWSESTWAEGISDREILYPMDESLQVLPFHIL